VNAPAAQAAPSGVSPASALARQSGMTLATAYVSPSVCDGRAYTYVAKNYYRGVQVLPPRCGTSTWGLRHLVERGRWDSTFDSKAAEAVSRGDDGGVYGYRLWKNQCPRTVDFRVIYNWGAYNGDGVRPQGVVTAYWVSTAATQSAPADDSRAEVQTC